MGAAGRVVTKIFEWTIGRTKPAEEDLQTADSVELAFRGANAPPWSSFNNFIARSFT